MDIVKKAIELLTEFKGDNFIHGTGCVKRLPELCSKYGHKVSFVLSSYGNKWSKPYHDEVMGIVIKAGFKPAGPVIQGAAPNAPKDDVYRIKEEVKKQLPDFIISVGGGSSIDATKAAVALAVLEDQFPDLNNYFGMGQVSEMLNSTGRELIPVVAVQVASGSAAHLTKYSNITDLETQQKMLIVDEAVTPPKALFDYSFTRSSPKDLTMDGAFDGISHCLEVLMGIPEDKYEKARDVCITGIELIVNNVQQAVENPDDEKAREAIGLGTDLGGYAIMIGGTNGAHLNSFSMTDILSHGRACALMNPYYVTFFSNAIRKRLASVAKIYSDAGFFKAGIESLSDRELGERLSNAMMELSRKVGFPTKLTDVKGFTNEHISRCLHAAKNPKLESKLKNMPVPLTADLVDEYIGSVLKAATTGNLGEIKNYSGN